MAEFANYTVECPRCKGEMPWFCEVCGGDGLVTMDAKIAYIREKELCRRALKGKTVTGVSHDSDRSDGSSGNG